MNKQGKHFIRFWLPVSVYLVLIFVLSSLPEPPLEGPEIPFFDKLLHITEYAVLGFLLIRGLKNSRLRLSDKNFVLLAVAFATLYGMSDEFHQHFVPNRYASSGDILFDCIGSIIGSMVYARRRRD